MNTEKSAEFSKSGVSADCASNQHRASHSQLAQFCILERLRADGAALKAIYRAPDVEA